MNKVLVMKGSSFTNVKNSFEIMAAKFMPYFEGGERLERQKRLKFRENFPAKLNAMYFLKAKMIY